MSEEENMPIESNSDTEPLGPNEDPHDATIPSFDSQWNTQIHANYEPPLPDPDKLLTQSQIFSTTTKEQQDYQAWLNSTKASTSSQPIQQKRIPYNPQPKSVFGVTSPDENK